METTTAHSLKTELKDRDLWFDGDSTIPADKVTNMITLGMPVDGVFVDQITEDIKQFNRLVSKDEQIGIKEGIKPLQYEWQIPNEYKTLDIVEYLADKLSDLSDEQCWTEGEEFERCIRTDQELKLYENRQLVPVLRVLIYVINTLQANDIVWGVGRGSSVSSYILYLIGVHDVDSVEYDLDIDDFLHD